MGESLPHIQEDGMSRLGDPQGCIPRLEETCKHPDRVATAQWKIWKIEKINHKLSQQYAEFQVIATDLI